MKGNKQMDVLNRKDGAYVIGISSTNEEICAASGRISTQKGTALEIYEKSQVAWQMMVDFVNKYI